LPAWNAFSGCRVGFFCFAMGYVSFVLPPREAGLQQG
jgi:hypothetical protein